MERKPCGNPNCRKCACIQQEIANKYNDPAPRGPVVMDRTDAYPPRKLRHPEIVETYGPQTAIDEVSNFPGRNEANPPMQPHYHPVVQSSYHYPLTTDNTYIETDDFSPNVSDTELLEYLLQKYHLNKEAVIHSIIKQKEHRFKMNLLKDFYHQFHKIVYRPIKEQYHVFKEWNYHGPYISREELQDYYEKYIKPTL